MSLNQIPGQDDIITRLKTIDGVDVFQGQYTTDGYVPVTDANGMFKPYITTVFGASYKARDDRGIVSERYDTVRTTVTVYCVSPTDRITRQFVDQVRDKLTGYVPTDCTQLGPYGGYIYVDADLGVNRYVHSVVFEYRTNMSYTT